MVIAMLIEASELCVDTATFAGCMDGASQDARQYLARCVKCACHCIEEAGAFDSARHGKSTLEAAWL
eukprot:8471050-Pyramimonas_sp.AAC.1